MVGQRLEFQETIGDVPCCPVTGVNGLVRPMPCQCRVKLAVKPERKLTEAEIEVAGEVESEVLGEV
jgi:hypothetical protein